MEDEVIAQGNIAQSNIAKDNIAQGNKDENVALEEQSKGKKVLTKDGYIYVPWGITSFAELQMMERGQEVSREIMDLAACMPQLVENIMMDEDTTDKSASIRAAGNELADLVESLMTDVKERKSLLDLAKSAAKSAFQKVLPPQALIKSADKDLVIFKDATGRMAWLGRYSNNIEDDDPAPIPNVIASESHQAFVKAVEAGEAPYPELWLWHEKSARVGVANWLCYDEETGFAMAAGVFDEDKTYVAEALAKSKGNGMSHGMRVLKVDARNPRIVTRHLTHEISVLPLNQAANKRTGFDVIKENAMIPENKANQLKTAFGLTDADISNLNAANKSQSEEANAQNLLRKEAVESETEGNVEGMAESMAESTAENPVNTSAEPVAEADEADKSSSAAFTDAQKKELAEVFAMQNEQFQKAIEASLKPLVDRIDQVSKEQQPQTLAAMLFPTQKEQSPKPPADLEKSKPAENKEPELQPIVADPGFNSVLQHIIPSAKVD